MIDQLVYAIAGHEMLSFLDAFFGYDQIIMHPDNQEKIAFMTKREIYCYKVMSFNVKNARATYQHLVNRMFKVHDVGIIINFFIALRSVFAR